MSDLKMGMRIFHFGRPVELLYRVDKLFDSEIWRVKPLFVEGPEKDELFEPGDLISFLHSKVA